MKPSILKNKQMLTRSAGGARALHVLWRAMSVLCSALLVLSCTTVEVQEDGKVVKKDVSVLGYNLGPPPRHDGIHKLFVPRVGNKTREPHLQMEATNILINEFTREQSYEIVPRRDEADGILEVVIIKISMSPVRYIDKSQSEKARGVPVEFRVVVYADVKMLNAKTGNKVWSINRIHGRYSFSTTEAFPFQLARREAIIQACGDLSREIADNAVERWD